MSAPAGGDLLTTVRAAFAARERAVDALLREAPEVAPACRDAAARFHRGGRLLVFGTGAAASDAQHVAVEFMHPVIVGKRALPTLDLSSHAAVVTDIGHRHHAFAHQVAAMGRPDDVVLGICGPGQSRHVVDAFAAARERGMLTLALLGGDAGERAAGRLVDHAFAVPSDDPGVVKEVHVTLYHLLWELVHVFFEHPGALDGVDGAAPALQEDAGATDAEGATVAPERAAPPETEGGVERLYPFLYSGRSDVEEVMAEVRRSSAEKAAEIVALRRSFGNQQAGAIAECAGVLARSFGGGGTLFAFGNGGSATDADALVAAFLACGPGEPALPACSLTADSAVVTALANDVGFEVVFARQLAGLGRQGDVAVGLSTSGSSPNLLRAFEAAKGLGMVTVGLAGHDGGAMAESDVIDHLFVIPSSSVHRIQEAQTTLYQVLRETTVAALRPTAAG